MHKLSGGIEARQIAQVGYRGHRDRAWDAPQSLAGLDDGLEAPGVHRLGPFVFQTLEAFGLFGHGWALFLKNNVLCWGGTDHLTEPAQGGRTPIGPPRITDIVPEQEGFEAQLGR